MRSGLTVIPESFAQGTPRRMARVLATVLTVVKGNYRLSAHDITSGTNGSCGTPRSAATGYDYITGLGSPQANNIIAAIANV